MKSLQSFNLDGALKELELLLCGSLHPEIGGLRFRLFADGDQVEDMQNKILNLITEADAIEATALAENRTKSEEEQKKFTALLDEVEALEVEIEGRKRLYAKKQQMRAPQPRKTVPDDAPIDQPQPDGTIVRPAARSQITGGMPIAATAKNHGWRSFGEFARAVAKAEVSRGQDLDPRLKIQMATPTTFGSEGIGPDGGFVIAPEFREEIQRKVIGVDSLLERCDAYDTTSNQLVLPADETTPWDQTHGIRAYWTNEASPLTQTKPELQTRNVKIEKLTCLVPVTSELMDDASVLSTYLREKAPEKIDYKIVDAIINGIGAGQPLGIMNAGCKVTQATGTGQSTNTVVFANITQMWARMPERWRRNAVWLINQDVEPQLQQMVVTGTASVGFPAYLPPGGLSQQPYGTLMGREVVVTEACQALGTEGDIILADLKQYICARKGTGLKFDMSIHLFFDADATAFRFILRLGGQPWWLNAITRAHGSNTLSPFVTLSSTRN